MVVRITKILVRGNFFGNDDNDEFFIEYKDKKMGVFKSFEYISLPFSITGKKDLFFRLLDEARADDLDLETIINSKVDIRNLVDLVYEHMDSSPEFSRQVLDWSLSRAFLTDNLLYQQIPEETSFTEDIARIVFAWEQLSDFYAIEGLVGGDGISNPFIGRRVHSLDSGILDVVEGLLPAYLSGLSVREKNKRLLQLSSMIEKNPEEIERAVAVQEKVFGQAFISENESKSISQSIESLSRTALTNNTEHAKFINSVIRFHNWMSMGLKRDDPKIDQYDSLCSPVKRAIRLIPEEFQEKLRMIKDATSPKGLAIAYWVDEEVIPGKDAVLEELVKLRKTGLPDDSMYDTFEFEDVSFYSGLCGGKWKGLKLLHEAKRLFGLKFNIAEGFSVSSLGISRALREEGILSLIERDIFDISDQREKIVARIFNIDFEKYIPSVFSRAKVLGEDLIVRSSMQGEDGVSNFSGTYESMACTIDGLNRALQFVAASYFSEEAVRSREDIGLAHIPGISMVVQRRLEGTGGVIQITSLGSSISYARTAEEAVSGNGTHETGVLEDLLEGSELEMFSDDFRTLYDVFGDIDVEFIKNGKLYLTQMRPKYSPAVSEGADLSGFPKIRVNSVKDLDSLNLEEKSILCLGFLDDEAVMGYAPRIMDVIRRNREYIAAVSGPMASVAHIPNKIEGHFKIPYFFEVKDDD